MIARGDPEEALISVKARWIVASGLDLSVPTLESFPDGLTKNRTPEIDGDKFRGFVGANDGFAVDGVPLGRLKVGRRLGMRDGRADDGASLGTLEGLDVVGISLGILDGLLVEGVVEGVLEGVSEGLFDGVSDGTHDGVLDG